MTEREFILRQLCIEMVSHGIETDRFTELWLASGVLLESLEFELANRLKQQNDYGRKIARQQSALN